GSAKAWPSGFCINHHPVQPFDLQGTRRRQGIRPGVTGSKSDIGSTVGEQNKPDRLMRLSPPLPTSQPMGLRQAKRERRCPPHGQLFHRPVSDFQSTSRRQDDFRAPSPERQESDLIAPLVGLPQQG